MWIQGNADSCYGFLDVSSIPETVPNLAWIDFHTFWGSTQMLLLSWSLFLSLKLEAVLPSLNLHAFKDLLDTFYSIVKLTGPIKWVRNAVHIIVIKPIISLWRIHSDLGFFFSSIFATQKICFWMPTLHFLLPIEALNTLKLTYDKLCFPHHVEAIIPILVILSYRLIGN